MLDGAIKVIVIPFSAFFAAPIFYFEFFMQILDISAHFFTPFSL
jgi:hypothetical protein